MLVTIEAVKLHLRITDEAEDALLEAYMAAASELVQSYLRVPADYWDVDEFVDSQRGEPPRAVQVATLLVVGALYEDREGGDPMSQAVKDILHQYRDPALA